MSTDRALEAARRIIACSTLYKGDPLKAAFGCIALSAEVGRLKDALGQLHDLVWGECPSLLNHDSGVLRVALDVRIKELLSTPPSSQPGNSEVTR